MMHEKAMICSSYSLQLATDFFLLAVAPATATAAASAAATATAATYYLLPATSCCLLSLSSKCKLRRAELTIGCYTRCYNRICYTIRNRLGLSEGDVRLELRVWIRDRCVRFGYQAFRLNREEIGLRSSVQG